MKRMLHSIVILLSLTIALIQQTYADSFSATALTDRYSSSPYAREKNAFYASDSSLAGQCTWYAYGRVIELAEKGELDSQAAALLYAALWGKSGRHAKYWPDFIGGTWHCTTTTSLPLEKRHKGLLAVYKFGDYGHVGFVEEVNADKSQYRLSDFNYSGDTNYKEKWYPFVGDDRIGGAYPCFYELPLPSSSSTATSLSEREKGSFVLAPLVVAADIHFGWDGRLGINVGVASYSDKENAEITIQLYNSSKSRVWGQTYYGGQISQQTGGFSGAGSFNGINQNLLTINDVISLNRNDVAFARVFFKNKSACKLFGESSTTCAGFSAYLANMNNLGAANSLQPGDTRYISINSSTSY